MKIFLLPIFSICVLAQSVLTLVPAMPTSAVKPGDVIQTTLNLTGAVSGTQWSLALPAGITATLWTPKAVTLAPANQALSCAASNLICLIAGTLANNGAIIPSTAFSGDIAIVALQVGSTITPGSWPVSLTGTISVDDAGTEIITTSKGFTVVVPVPVLLLDLNGDGLVSVLDSIIAVDQALGKVPCTNGDVNHDGKCDIKDVRIVIKAAK